MALRLLFGVAKPPADTGGPAFVMSSAGIQEWISVLPIAHRGEALRKVYRTLTELNGMQIPWRNRLAFCLALERPLDPLFEGLRQSYLQSVFPLSEKAEKAAELAIHINTFLLVSYKLILQDWADGPEVQQQTTRTQAQTALLLALHHLERVVFVYRSLSKAFPKDLWREVHGLFATAEAGGWVDQPLEVALFGAPRSPVQAYKRILLMALLDVQHIRRDELDRVLSQFHHWTQAVDLLPSSGGIPPDHCNFFVQLQDDMPPRPIRRTNAAEEACTGSAQCRLLRTDGMLRLLDALHRRQKEGQESNAPTLRPETLKVLAKSWWRAPLRRQARYHSSDSVDVFFGLTPLHRTLIADVAAPAVEEEKKEESNPTPAVGLRSAFTQAPDLKQAMDAWDLAEQGSFFLEARVEQIKEAFEQTRIIEYPPVACQVLDTSSGGYRLSVRQSEISKVRAGDLVGIRSGGAEHWNLGSIRWLTPDRAGHISFGVQLHFPRAFPLLISTIQGTQRSEPQPAFLSVHHAQGATPVLILPASPGITTKQLELEHQGRRARVRLAADAILATESFEVRAFEAGQIRLGTPNHRNDLGYLVEQVFASPPKPQVHRSEADATWEEEFADLFSSS